MDEESSSITPNSVFESMAEPSQARRRDVVEVQDHIDQPVVGPDGSQQAGCTRVGDVAVT